VTYLRFSRSVLTQIFLLPISTISTIFYNYSDTPAKLGFGFWGLCGAAARSPPAVDEGRRQAGPTEVAVEGSAGQAVEAGRGGGRRGGRRGWR
jgi:hypothetical protein